MGELVIFIFGVIVGMGGAMFLGARKRKRELAEKPSKGNDRRSGRTGHALDD